MQATIFFLKSIVSMYAKILMVNMLDNTFVKNEIRFKYMDKYLQWYWLMWAT